MRSKREVLDRLQRDRDHRAGPAGTLVLSFDNLGEASELERGTWPAGEPLGRHPSVTVALPRLLDELDALGLSATFFVEGINCELYPDTLAEIGRRGHELGLHGWRHEAWAPLTAEREREALALGTRAFRTLGLPARGFRPPGGELTGSSATLLREAGIDWCSPAGGKFDLRNGLAWVPFRWPLVDAYHLMPRFAELRDRCGDPRDPLAPVALADRMSAELDTLADDGGRRTLILHPSLMLDDAWWAGTRQVLGQIKRLAGAGRIWAAPGGQVADWLRATGSRVPDKERERE